MDFEDEDEDDTEPRVAPTAVLLMVIRNLYPGRIVGSLLTSSMPMSTAGSCPSPPAHGPLKGNRPSSHNSVRLSTWVSLTSTVATVPLAASNVA